MKISTSNFYKLVKWQFDKSISQPCELDCVFVVGPPRSGTSLLQSRIGVHSGFISMQSETGFFRPDFYLRAKGKSYSPGGGG